MFFVLIDDCIMLSQHLNYNDKKLACAKCALAVSESDCVQSHGFVSCAVSWFARRTVLETRETAERESREKRYQPWPPDREQRSNATLVDLLTPPLVSCEQK